MGLSLSAAEVNIGDRAGQRQTSWLNRNPFGHWSLTTIPTSSCSCGGHSNSPRGGSRVQAVPADRAGSAGARVLPMKAPDPFAEVRAEFVGGLGRRVETMQGALVALENGFDAGQAEVLYRAAHSLSGTAASFGAEDLSEVA